MSGPDYQVVYGVGLLDDIHNYFPSLLYDQGRFQTLPQVLSYVRTQMNTRFNLFAYGASLHRASAPAPAPVPAPVQEPVSVTRPSGRTRDAATLNILLGLLGLGTDIRLVPDFGLGTSPQGPRAPADIWTSFNTPVVVAPSAEIISANTEIIEASSLVDVSGASLTQNICTVCQDAMRSPEVCRRLRPCQHSFHRACIDEWFRRSVFCPSCRHDIRNPTPSPRLGAVAQPAIIPQENLL
jgi:hypothetical protein